MSDGTSRPAGRSAASRRWSARRRCRSCATRAVCSSPSCCPRPAPVCSASASRFDATRVPVGVVIEEPTPEAAACSWRRSRNTRYFQVDARPDRRAGRGRARRRPPRRHRRAAGDFAERLGARRYGAGPGHHRRQRSQHGGARRRLCAGRLADLARRSAPCSAGQQAPAADRGRAAVLVQRRSSKAAASWCPGSIALIHDDDRHTADRARGGARVGARHHRGAAGHAGPHRPSSSSASWCRISLLGHVRDGGVRAAPPCSCSTCRCAARSSHSSASPPCSCAALSIGPADLDRRGTSSWPARSR